MKIQTEFNLGDIVYHKLIKYQEDLLAGVVVQYHVSSEHSIEYRVVWESATEGVYFPVEIMSEEDYELNKRM